MASVNSRARDIPISVEGTVEASPKHPEPGTGDCDDVECDSLSQPLVNFPADVTLPEESEYSQAPATSATAAFSQQPSPEFLMSLGVKVRDFAYENTLPAIVPVPRVPRQVQPAPRALKRLQRDWDDEEGPLNSLSPARPFSGQTGTKKPRSLERKPTEPLQEPVIEHTRNLERIAMKRVCSLRNTLPTTPRTRFSASPPTSPLTPPSSNLVSQEPEPVQTSAFPFVVHVDNDNPSVIPASQLDSESQLVPLHPVLYTSFTLGPRSSSGCSPAPGPPQDAPPASLRSPLIELPSPAKESGGDPRVRRRRSRGTPPPSSRYQLRQRPIPSSRTSTLSRCLHQANSTSKSLSRRTRRVR